ncbi:dihydrofolate reductase [Verrucomicrobiaceae bacterium R5-34]|uniref:Dihydrofolate reductase n=1 Tax=Oceaniferula flava TaxID=2800421 RepID=A0AAE2SCJ7_9BACT|nr:dihydrofolate reductase [Oceaniferula flavus]MBK1830332.1 dihydrofolate reductase [Verrucomicrobiaceae bacterium R5-34]MBK1854424.1 dihydrofolate reductase [Oceaniferula flavus]MBM1135730.1 dihydrofolate reductase [Oceaniferula flavus]
MKLTAIVAMTSERIIGKDGGLPWHLPEDLKVFKKYTTGHPIVMGRKTWDSIGFPLPKRQSIVLTRDSEWSAEGAEVIHTPADLANLELMDPEVYIIGGAQVYELFMDQLDEILLSYVYEKHPGDTKLPEFEPYFPVVTVEEKYDTFELRRYSK